MPSVSSLESTKCGTAPQYVTAFGVATKVRAGVSTSSPGDTPAITSARCSAAVPLAVAITRATPIRSASISSNRSTYEPADETQPVSIVSRTYRHSFPANSGSCSAARSPTTDRIAWTTRDGSTALAVVGLDSIRSLMGTRSRSFRRTNAWRRHRQRAPPQGR